MNKTALLSATVVAFTFGCDPDLLTGLRRDGGSAGGHTGSGGATSASNDGGVLDSGTLADGGSQLDGAGVAPRDAGEVAFFPTMFVTIDGVRKSFRLSAVTRVGAASPTGQPTSLSIEFTTGARNLGAEATPGEIMSEVWLRLPLDPLTAGSYDCARADGTVGPRTLSVTWSKNHTLSLGRSDMSTPPVDGSCAATFSILDPSTGGRLRGTFSATVEGGHDLRDGVFDAIVPTNPDPAGN